MSYEIFYGKQFVKLQKTSEVIPMFLAGSNNCYEIGIGGRNGRRVRDWQPMTYYNHKDKLSEKPEVILRNLDTELRKYIKRHRGEQEPFCDKASPDDIHKHFGYYASIAIKGGHCGSTSWNLWQSQFTNGIKGALTIEELDKLDIHPFFSAYGNNDGRPAEVLLKTEQEYFTELKKWKQWRDGINKSFSLSFSPLDTDSVLRRLRAGKPKKSPKEKTLVKQDHYFVLTDGCNALIKYTSRGYRYGYSKSDGKKFRTENDAEKLRKRLVAKQSYKAEIWKVERIDSPYSFAI